MLFEQIVSIDLSYRAEIGIQSQVFGVLMFASQFVVSCQLILPKSINIAVSQNIVGIDED